MFIFFLCCFFPLPTGSFGYTRDLWDMRKTQKGKKEETRTGNKRERDSHFNQSMTGARFNDIQVEGGGKREESNDMIKPKNYLNYFTLYRRASLSSCASFVSNDEFVSSGYVCFLFSYFMFLSLLFLFSNFIFSQSLNLSSLFCLLTPIPQQIYARVPVFLPPNSCFPYTITTPSPLYNTIQFDQLIDVSRLSGWATRPDTDS